MKHEKYYYYKTINNNCITALNRARHEVILMGKAIGIKCNRNPYSAVDPTLIERVFITQNNTYLESLLATIPYEYHELIEDILNYAAKVLNYDFKDSLYVILLDHIYFAQRRIKENGNTKNPLLAEIKLFYPKEFQLSIELVELINLRIHTDFDENEAAFIAFHLVNAMSNLSQKENRTLIKMLDKTIDFISSMKSIHLDDTSFYYSRLISHIKYFLIRKLDKQGSQEMEIMSKEICQSIQEAHPFEWEQAEQIKQFLEHELGIQVSIQETAYLTMHIVPMITQGGRKL